MHALTPEKDPQPIGHEPGCSVQHWSQSLSALREERENHPAAPLTSQTPQSGDRLHIDPLINYYLQAAAAQLDGEGTRRG